MKFKNYIIQVFVSIIDTLNEPLLIIFHQFEIISGGNFLDYCFPKSLQSLGTTLVRFFLKLAPKKKTTWD